MKDEGVPASEFTFTTIPGDVTIVGDCMALDLDAAPGIVSVVRRSGHRAAMYAILEENDLDRGQRAE